MPSALGWPHPTALVLLAAWHARVGVMAIWIWRAGTHVSLRTSLGRDSLEDLWYV